jgi:hypothetical protein
MKLVVKYNKGYLIHSLINHEINSVTIDIYRTIITTFFQDSIKKTTVPRNNTNVSP